MRRCFLKKSWLCFLTIVFIQCSKNTIEYPTNTIDLKVSFTTNFTETTVGTPILFTSNSTDNESNILSWQWDFADDTSVETTKNATHTFTLAGSYLIKLTIRNTSGKTATFEKRILVKNVKSPDYGNLIGLKEKLTNLYPKTMVAAHRAYQKNYPENSAEAITDAALNSINIVEIDARLTLDKELIIMHDATTLRTTNGNFIVAQKTLNELKQLRLLYKGNATAYTIPTLKECLEVSKGKIYVNIDASWDNSVFYYNKIYNIVAALNMVNMVMIYTESAEVAKGLLEIDSNVTVLLGAGSAMDYNNASNMTQKAAIWHMAKATLTPNYTNWPTNNGIKLWANAYVNSNDTPPISGGDAVVKNLLDNQISIIQTDYPLEIISYLQSQNLWLK
jgi:glycerophosphoryl diester phosphodiesterase